MSKNINEELDNFNEKASTSTISDELDDFSTEFKDESIKKPETLESKYLQPIYDVANPVMKGLSIIEKPLSMSIGAGRSLGKLISGQENPSGPIMEEIKGFPFPTQAGSLTADLTEAGIGTEPFASDILPQSIRDQFPKASALVEGFNPNMAAEAVATSALGASLPYAAGKKAASMAADDVGIAKKALIRGSERDLKYVGDLQSSGKLDSLANVVLSDKNIRKNINNPEKIVEYLQGVKKEVTDKITGRRERKDMVTGKLSNIGSELGSRLNVLAKKTKDSPISSNDYITSITNEIIDEMNIPGSGMDFNPSAIKRELSKYIKPSEIDGFDDMGDFLDLEDIVSIKRGSADKLYDMRKSVVPDTDRTSLSKIVADKLWKKADSDIFNLAEKAGDYDVIKLNNEFSDYQKIRELYANKDIAAKYIPSLLEDLVPMALVGGGTAAATGSPYMGAIAAGGYPLARGAVSGLAGTSPSRSLSMRLGAIEPSLRAVSKIPTGVSSAMLTSFQIPRNTKAILENKDIVREKIASQAGPMAASLFDQAQSEGEVGRIINELLQSNPAMFEGDRYNRFNNKISDPMLKRAAIKDIVNKGGSAYEQAEKTKKLINEDILED